MPKPSPPKLQQEGFIRLALASPFLDELASRSIDFSPALTAVGVSEEMARNPDVYVHAELVYGLLNTLAAIAGDRYLGVRVGESFDFESWPPFARAFQPPSTLVKFLSEFVRLVPQESSAVRHSLVIQAESAAYLVDRQQQPLTPPEQVTGFGAAIYVRLLRKVTGRNWNPRRVTWESRYIAGVPLGYMGIETRLGPKPGMKLSFPVEWLFEEVALEPRTEAFARAQVEETVSVVAAIQGALRNRLDRQDLGAIAVARLLGIEADRLIKALKQHGTTLPREIKRLKVSVAQAELAGDVKSVSEIGAQLGYADKAHFTRFFKSQTGMTPTEFRTDVQKRISEGH